MYVGRIPGHVPRAAGLASSSRIFLEGPGRTLSSDFSIVDRSSSTRTGFPFFDRVLATIGQDSSSPTLVSFGTSRFVLDGRALRFHTKCVFKFFTL
jgi:hypothetical protein